MNQKLKLSQGVCVPSRMQPFIPSQAQKSPAIKLTRLQQLLKSHRPKICIVRGEGLGDVITTTPTIRGLVEMFSSCEITYATNTKYLTGALVRVLQYNPMINEIIERELLNEAEYDLVINLHCPCIHYEKQGNPPLSRIDLFARHAGVKPSSMVPTYYPQKEEIEEGRDFLSSVIDKPLIMVQPFASTPRRSLEHSKIKQALRDLYQEFAVRSVIVTHEGDFQTDVIWDNIPGSVILKNADVRKIAGVMAHCNLLLCPDSSLMHLAGAMHVPTVAIFGPTHPAARINHYEQAVAVWGGEGLAPCPCVVGDSMVLTSNGYREIQDLEVGQSVKTVDSKWNKITKFHKNDRGTRNLYEIESLGSNEPIIITEDHKMLAVRYSNEQFRRSRFKSNREWIKAKDLTEKDFLCIPRNKQDNVFPEVDLQTCQLLGIYAAEGHLRPDRKSVVFTVGSHEKDLIETIESLVRDKYPGTVGVYPSIKDKSTRVEVYSEALLERIQNLFGRNRAIDKTLPLFLFTASDLEIKAFISGYFAGDAYQTDKGSILSTVSRKMAYAIQELMTRFGFLAKIYKRTRDTNYKKDSIIYRVYCEPQGKTSRYIVDADYIYIPIKKISVSERTDEFVYDITVENSTTFCIQNLGTWDCWYGACTINHTCWSMITPQRIVRAVTKHLRDTTKIDILQLLKKNTEITIQTEII